MHPRLESKSNQIELFLNIIVNVQMKKKVIMIMFAILWISVFSIQANIRIGAKTGVNLAKAAFSVDAIKTNNFTGFQIGPVIEISGLTGFGVDAAILYSKHGIKIKEKLTIIDYEEKASTLDIPVNLKMKFLLVDIAGIYLSSGPYISFNLDNNTSFNQIKEDWGNKRFGVGLNFGGGFELIKQLQIGVNYQLALNDDYGFFTSNWMDDFKNINAKTRVWSITAAFFF